MWVGCVWVCCMGVFYGCGKQRLRNCSVCVPLLLIRLRVQKFCVDFVICFRVDFDHFVVLVLLYQRFIQFQATAYVKDKQCNFLKSNEGECFILNVSLGTWGVIILSTSSREISQHFILHHSLEDGSIWKFTTYILRDLLKRPQKSFARV